MYPVLSIWGFSSLIYIYILVHYVFHESTIAIIFLFVMVVINIERYFGHKVTLGIKNEMLGIYRIQFLFSIYPKYYKRKDVFVTSGITSFINYENHFYVLNIITCSILRTDS